MAAALLLQGIIKLNTHQVRAYIQRSVRSVLNVFRPQVGMEWPAAHTAVTVSNHRAAGNLGIFCFNARTFKEYTRTLRNHEYLEP